MAIPCPTCGSCLEAVPLALALTGPIAVGKSTIIDALGSCGLATLHSGCLDVTGVLPALPLDAPAYVIVSDEGADTPEFGAALSTYLTAKHGGGHPAVAAAAALTFQMWCIGQQRARYAAGLKQVAALAGRGLPAILLLERCPLDSYLVFGPANGLSESELGVLRLSVETSWAPACVYILTASEDEIVERARRRGRAAEAPMLSESGAAYEKAVIARYDPAVWAVVETAVLRYIPTGTGPGGAAAAAATLAEGLRSWTRYAADRLAVWSRNGYERPTAAPTAAPTTPTPIPSA